MPEPSNLQQAFAAAEMVEVSAFVEQPHIISTASFGDGYGYVVTIAYDTQREVVYLRGEKYGDPTSRHSLTFLPNERDKIIDGFNAAYDALEATGRFVTKDQVRVVSQRAMCEKCNAYLGMPHRRYCPLVRKVESEQ